MTDFLNYCGMGAFAVVIISMLVEITPIKLNPIQWLGNHFNAGLKSDIANIKIDVDRISSKMSEENANDARYRIIRFDDEIRHDQRHTEEHFNQILDDIKDYEEYCEEHPHYKNSKAVFAIQNINSVYMNCRNNNSFLI